MITTETRVGHIAAEHPLSTRVFHRHGIDFCCGGGKPLAAACEAKGIDSAQIVAEITAELDTAGPSSVRWDREPLDVLIDHIVSTFHRPLGEELPRLEAMLRKVVSVHGDKNPQAFAEMLTVFLALKAALTDHMAKEEQILFPMIVDGGGAMAGGPISMMEHEHDSAAGGLRRLRELTDDYQAPEDACTTWRALWHGLSVLERDLHEHIHLENNVLFPRALAG